MPTPLYYTPFEKATYIESIKSGNLWLIRDWCFKSGGPKSCSKAQLCSIYYRTVCAVRSFLSRGLGALISACSSTPDAFAVYILIEDYYQGQWQKHLAYYCEFRDKSATLCSPLFMEVHLKTSRSGYITAQPWWSLLRQPYSFRILVLLLCAPNPSFALSLRPFQFLPSWLRTVL